MGDEYPLHQEYLNYLENECGFKKTTILRYQVDMRLFFYFLKLKGYFPGDIDLNEINREHIRKFLIYLKEERNNQVIQCNNKVGTVKGYINFLKARGYFNQEENPAEFVPYYERPKKRRVSQDRNESRKRLINEFPYSQEYFNYLEVERGFTPATIKGADVDLGFFFKFLRQEDSFSKKIEIKNIKAEHIRNFLLYSRKELNNQADTCNRKLSTLKSYFHFLKVSGYLDKKNNPAEYVPSLRIKYKRPVSLSREESEKLIQAAWQYSRLPHRDLAILRLFLQTGCRLHELVKLRREDIDLEDGTVRYWGKGNVERKVPLTEKTAAALQEYLRRHSVHYKGRPEVFISLRGNPISRDAVQSMFHRFRIIAGIKKQGLTLHNLRHTCLTLLINEGVDINVVQSIAGHKLLWTTQKYVYVCQEEVKEAMEKHPLG